MKGIQEALGIDAAPTHMKGLQVFIADIRNCQTKDAEEKRVKKELAKIRQKFTAKTITGYDKKKYIWKLLYSYMLGYEIDFGHQRAVELCSSPKFSEKTAGYLAIHLLLSDKPDILMLVVNSIKNDMITGNEHVIALALNTVANIGGSEFADNLFGDISKMVLSPSTHCSAYIKRKACICLLRLYRRDNDTLQPEPWRKKLGALFHDKDIGLLTSVSGFMIGILEQGSFPVEEWAEILPSVVQCLSNMVQGDCPEHYEYYHVPAPWLQTKLLRILQFFPMTCFEGETLQRVNTILHSTLTKPAVQRTPSVPGAANKKRSKADAERQNRSNAEHAILFEAMNLMIHLEDKCDPEATRTASSLLGSFISSPDPNIRYLGLETMARLATNISTQEHLERYKNLILEKMHESDISIRRQALNLLYALCRPENWRQIVDELLDILSQSDALLQEELVLKIAILAERNAPNFGWYVDVVFKVLESAPESVGDDVWYRVVQVVTGFEDGVGESEKANLQRHAATKSFQNLKEKQPHETLLKLCAYLIGEFGHHLPSSVSPKAKFDALARHFPRTSSQTKAILTLALVKQFNANPDDFRHELLPFLEELQISPDVELQTRACELLMLMKDEDLLDHVLFPMPQYAESVQQNNPLVQRLKFQHKSRAHTRAQLEEAAKSEGGVYKQGANTSGRSGIFRDGDSRTIDSGMLQMPQDRSPSANGPRAESGSESESGSDSSEDDRQAGGHGSNPQASREQFQQDPRELWQHLCIVPQGRLWSSNSLMIDIKQEYMGAMGRLTIMFTNQSNEPLINFHVRFQEVPFLRTQQVGEPFVALKPRENRPVYMEVQCLRPFLAPAEFKVEYSEGNAPVSQRLMLPAVMTKFMTPAVVPMDQFREVFESYGGPPREAQTIGLAKVPPNQWPNYLTKGFNLHMLQESLPNATFAAGTLNTATPDPAAQGKMMTVPCLVRIEYDADRNMVRLTVRAQHGEVASTLVKILESYLTTPMAQANGNAGGYPPRQG